MKEYDNSIFFLGKWCKLRKYTDIQLLKKQEQTIIYLFFLKFRNYSGYLE